MIEILRKPLITEKNTSLSSTGVYVFEVDHRADKEEIRKAVEKAFRVKVKTVRTMNIRDRPRRLGRNTSRVRHYKKAMVQLAPGEKIKLFEGV